MKRYSEPWKPEKFLKGDQVTYPQQHESVIFYRAEPVDSFWGPNSILQKRYIEASNGFYTEGGEKGEGSELSAKSHGVFGGFIETAEYYARGDRPDPVLKLEVPAKDTVTIYVPEDQRQKRGKHGDPETGSLKNLEEMHDHFGSPEKMREVCLDSLENREGFGGYEWVMFMVPHEVPVSPEENWIKGVWDKDFYSDPHFESLKKFVETLKSRHPKAVPEGIDPDHTKEEIRRELHELEKMRKLLSRMDEALRFGRKQLKADKLSQLPERKAGYLENTAEKYEKFREDIQELMEEEFDTDIQDPETRIRSVAQVNPESMKNLKKRIGELEEEVEKIYEDEHSHGEQIARQGGGVEEFREERQYERKVEERLTEDFAELPDFRPLLEKLTGELPET